MTLKWKLRLLSLCPTPVRRAVMVSRYRREVETDGERELQRLGEFVGKGDLALDVGGNLGIYAYELGRISGKVIAFEPNPTLARFLAKLRLPGVEVRRVALSGSDGAASLNVPQTHSGHGLASLDAGVASRSAGGAALDVMPIDTARLDSLTLPTIRFIKIDVEGHEESVLDGAMGTLGRDRPTLLIEIDERHNPDGLKRIADRLAGLGYEGKFLWDDAWQPLSSFRAEVHQDPSRIVGWQVRHNPIVTNFLFVPKAG